MHNVKDFGYPDGGQHVRDVRVGDTFRAKNALGVCEYRVLRRHREVGYFECVFERWITEVPAFRQGFVGSIEIRSRADILRLMYAD